MLDLSEGRREGGGRGQRGAGQSGWLICALGLSGTRMARDAVGTHCQKGQSPGKPPVL